MLMMRPLHSLYLCYAGLREPLVQTQVLPYLRQLRAGGIDVTLLTFEPHLRREWTRTAIQEWRECLQSEGIRWHARAYHKSPSLPATGYDIAVGAVTAARLVRHYRTDVLHARGHVAAAMGTLIKRRLGCRLIFDIRGMMADEYADAGHWSRGGLAYRVTKRTERALLRGADAYVVLTDRGRKELKPLLRREGAEGRPVEVIPCCVDLSRFDRALEVRAEARAAMGLQHRRVIVYVGALGGWYLTAEMAQFVAAVQDHDATAFGLFVTQSDPDLIRRELRRCGVSESAYRVTQARAEDVPRLLAASDLALSFIKPCYSKRFSSPTKLAEYLAAGLPVISTAGVGDVDALLHRRQVGASVSQLAEEEYLGAYDRVVTLMGDRSLAARCRAAAHEEFSLETIGGPRYRRLYDRLMRK
jgi:glycosyltransferase involved in cell wall biosynthesis